MTNWQVIKMSESSNGRSHSLSPLSNLNQLVHFEINSFDFSIYLCLRFTIKLFLFFLLYLRSAMVVYGTASRGRQKSKRTGEVCGKCGGGTNETDNQTHYSSRLTTHIKQCRLKFNEQTWTTLVSTVFAVPLKSINYTAVNLFGVVWKRFEFHLVPFGRKS